MDEIMEKLNEVRELMDPEVVATLTDEELDEFTNALKLLEEIAIQDNDISELDEINDDDK